jgi:large repetitive protein
VALGFAGYASTQKVNLGNLASLQITGSMTVTGWAKFTAFGADDDQIYSKFGGTDGAVELKATRDCGSQTASFMISGTGDIFIERCSNTVLSTGTWYFIAGVYDASAQTLRIYVNGADDSGTLQGTVPASIHNSALNAYIGSRPADSETLNGLLSDVRVYNRALSAVEIAEIYSGSM